MRRQLKIALLYLSAMVGAFGAGNDSPVWVGVGLVMWMSVHWI